ncbi:MAG TPA: MoxR family ATPase [Fervidobacterium sp.]|nr:MoxR family ATPase [Fervidobacterium sp.]HPT54265.1 MoxR family ATPase [Fervidobacterium sp.]HPZ17299.1 MoxR family ATPase [Fervidobacterium sp.]HQE48370.1 MoxR family ATPase [Fervidobacterium sp.]HUM42093.1 MoxR family ATPase [Fervidobacterium sp.]
MTVNEAKHLSKGIMACGEIPLLIGHFGVGKTDIARDIAKETGRKLTILVLSQMEPGDLIGLPARDENKTKFLPPDWWPDDGNVIILLDEINRAHRSIRNAIMQLLIDKRIHNHILPEGTWIMASMNPPDENYDQVELITDPAFLSRFFIFEVHPEPKEWICWAKENNILNDIVDFIEKYPEFLSVHGGVSLKTSIKPSPRSWYKLGKVLSVLSEDDRKHYAYILASGIVGPEAAKVFVDKIASSDVYSPTDVLLNGNIPESLDIHQANGLLVRLVDYFSTIDDDQIGEIKKDLDRIADNLIRLSHVVPKDSFEALMRMLVNLSDMPGLKGEFCDELMRKLIGKVG